MGASHQINTPTRTFSLGSICSCRLEKHMRKISTCPNLSGVIMTQHVQVTVLRLICYRLPLGRRTCRPSRCRTSKYWGMQPIRLSAFDPFCGVGFVTTDGPIWEHARALLKPSFNKANISDLPILESYLRSVITDPRKIFNRFSPILSVL